MFISHKNNYLTRILEDDHGNYKFDILFAENLFISDNKTYPTAGECIDAYCDYLKKLCAHNYTEPFEVKL